MLGAAAKCLTIVAHRPKSPHSSPSTDFLIAHTKLLETLATCTKQTIGCRSNRPQMRKLVLLEFACNSPGWGVSRVGSREPIRGDSRMSRWGQTVLRGSNSCSVPGRFNPMSEQKASVSRPCQACKTLLIMGLGAGQVRQTSCLTW